MDEITIGDKVYISSKRAAKITGYAKDYVGQLCREGRIEAKLVGRSWYVLESAIREHRFGSGPAEPEEQKQTPDEVKDRSATWQTPAYTAQTPAYVPELTRTTTRLGDEAVTTMQEAWREWFDQKIKDGAEKLEANVTVLATETVQEEIIPPQKQDDAEEVHVSRIEEDARQESQEEEVPLIRSYASRETGERIPAHTPPVADLRYTAMNEEHTSKRKTYSLGGALMQALLVVLMVAAATTALIGSGYAQPLFEGTSINLGLQRPIVEFLSGEFKAKK